MGDVWCWGHRDSFGNGCRGSSGWQLLLTWLWARESQLWAQNEHLGEPRAGLRSLGSPEEEGLGSDVTHWAVVAAGRGQGTYQEEMKGRTLSSQGSLAGLRDTPRARATSAGRELGLAVGSVMQDRADGPGAVSVPWGDSRGQNHHHSSRLRSCFQGWPRNPLVKIKAHLSKDKRLILSVVSCKSQGSPRAWGQGSGQGSNQHPQEPISLLILSIPAGDKRLSISYQMIAMAPWAVFKPRFVQILDEFSEDQSAQELDSWVDFGLCFMGLQGTTKKPFFPALCFEV